MKILEWIAKNENPLDKLSTDYGIIVKHHPTLPLCVLNYSQIDSPRNALTDDCRSLTLDSQDYSLVARSFTRFYNWGELSRSDLRYSQFNFADCYVTHKEDGSLTKFFYYGDTWHVHTRGSFGEEIVNGDGNKTWKEMFQQAYTGEKLDAALDRRLVYICEFCSLENKIVRTYSRPTFFLLTAFDGATELNSNEVDAVCPSFMKRPNRVQLHSIDEVKGYVTGYAASDSTFEGVVICDSGFRRWKVKSPKYIALHAAKNNQSPDLLEFVKSGETKEFLLYFPEYSEQIEKLQTVYDNELAHLEVVYNNYKNTDSQKEFALSVKDERFSPVLFMARRNQTTVREEFVKYISKERLCEVSI